MNDFIIKIIKFGVPFIVLGILIYAEIILDDYGDAEFGAIGHSGGILLMLSVALLVYFVAGFIFWLVTKRNFILQSFGLSILIIILFFLIIKIFS